MAIPAVVFGCVLAFAKLSESHFFPITQLQNLHGFCLIQCANIKRTTLDFKCEGWHYIVMPDHVFAQNHSILNSGPSVLLR